MGKTQLFINFFRDPTSTCGKHNWGKQPTVDCTLEPIQRSGVKQCREGHSTFGPESTGKAEQIGTFFTLTLHSNGCRSSGMSNSSIEADRSSLNRQWLELESVSVAISAARRLAISAAVSAARWLAICAAVSAARRLAICAVVSAVRRLAISAAVSAARRLAISADISAARRLECHNNNNFNNFNSPFQVT